MDETNAKWRFAVVGNIVMQHLDENGEVRYGTVAFSGGTKVYIFNRRVYGQNNDCISVIARNRFGNYCFDSIPLRYLENLRCQRVYKPTVLRIVDHYVDQEGWTAWNQMPEDRKAAEDFVKKHIVLVDGRDTRVI